jgi:hypothetical protein
MKPPPVELGRDGDLVMEMRFANGSRILGLPQNERTVRIYSEVVLLVIDEGSRVSDELYKAVTPMLSVSKGQLLGLSTPKGRRGWFWKAWHKEDGWERYQVDACDSPRADRDFLAIQRQRLTQREFEEEYLCVFNSVEGAVLNPDDIEAAFVAGGVPLFGPGEDPLG